MSELKPCPFCGSEAQITLGVGGQEFITCPNDCYYVSEGKFHIKDWNTRPIEDTLRAELEEAKEQNLTLNGELNNYILDNHRKAAEIKRLKEYAGHKSSCMMLSIAEEPHCTCGFNPILKGKKNE